MLSFPGLRTSIGPVIATAAVVVAVGTRVAIGTDGPACWRIRRDFVTLLSGADVRHTRALLDGSRRS